jgi:hypothetical protein
MSKRDLLMSKRDLLTQETQTVLELNRDRSGALLAAFAISICYWLYREYFSSRHAMYDDVTLCMMMYREYLSSAC